MSEQSGRKVERGDSEERFGAPVGEAEEETSRRPAGATPGVTPGSASNGASNGASHSASDGADDIDEDELRRRTELNPDDFE